MFENALLVRKTDDGEKTHEGKWVVKPDDASCICANIYRSTDDSVFANEFRSLDLPEEGCEQS